MGLLLLGFHRRHYQRWDESEEKKHMEKAERERERVSAKDDCQESRRHRASR